MKPINLVEQYLSELNLGGIREGLANRLREARQEDLGYEDFLNLCLHDETQYRKNARIARLFRNSGLRSGASLEGLDMATPRALDKKLLNELESGRFIDNGLNVLIMGPTGVGKSYLATALGNAACRRGKTTFFYRMNALSEKLLLARAGGTYLNLIKRLAAADLIILDDFGIKPLAPQQFQDLYDLLDERTENKACVITSQLPVQNWPEVISDAVVCEAITDRIVPRSIKIVMKGDSYRKKKARADGAGSTLS